MGIDCQIFKELIDLSGRFTPQGRSLMLGRQKFQIERSFVKHYNQAIARAGLGTKRFVYLQDDGYAETLFDKLGFGKIETMDYTGYEGEVIEQDLNQPVPKALHNSFDFIFDGGTIEHVFNVPQALENVFHMLKKGGRFVSVNGMNNWIAHGMYQFGPELAWAFWRRKCDCTVHKCEGMPKFPTTGPNVPFPDAAETGKRLRLRGKIPDGRFYLYYEVEKTRDAMPEGSALQSDYQATWTESIDATPIGDSA